MTYVEDYARFVDALDRRQDLVRAQRRERQELRRNLTVLALVCVVAVVLVLLATVGVGDAAIAGGAA